MLINHNFNLIFMQTNLKKKKKKQIKKILGNISLRNDFFFFFFQLYNKLIFAYFNIFTCFLIVFHRMTVLYHMQRNIRIFILCFFYLVSTLCKSQSSRHRQIRTPSQIFEFLVLFCREFNADSYGTILNNGYVLAEIQLFY